mgnify:CR=1 FL=1
MNFDYLTAARYFKMYRWFIEKNHDIVSFEESISPNQISSKLWLVNELKKVNDNDQKINIDIVGSWYGWPLVDMLVNTFNVDKIRLYDLDIQACRIANRYAELFECTDTIKTFPMNYWDDVNSNSKADIIINCSSEHMRETFSMFKERYPLQPIFAIQSNNMTEVEDHINCCESIEELIVKNGIKNVLYSGELNFNYIGSKGIYKRFMVIGSF